MRPSSRSSRSTTRVSTLLVLASTLMMAACSGGDDSADPTSISTGSTVGPESETTGVERTDPPRSDPPVSEPQSSDAPATTESAGATIATVPVGGIPGLDSDDPFCSAWSRFAGSFQALAFASNFAPPDDAIRLEVAASGAVTDAVDDLDANMPSELESEREVFIVGLLGPFTQRAAEARAAMTEAGISTDEVNAISRAWLTAIAETGFGDPDLAVTVPAELGDRFDSAVASFSSMPPIASDQSLVTDASAPLTEAYVAENCPDQGTLGGNDVIDE